MLDLGGGLCFSETTMSLLQSLCLRSGLSLAVALFSLLSYPPLDAAEGIRALPESGEGLAKAGGKFANLDDPSVVRQNPANMSLIEGTKVMVSMSLLHGDTEFTSPLGTVEHMRSPWKYSGGLYIVSNPCDSPWSYGFGISAPYGLSVEWDQTSFPYVAPYSASLYPASFTPGIAYDFCDNLTLGFNLDITWAQLDITQAYPWAAVLGIPGLPDGVQDFDADGWGLAPMASIAWDINDCQRLTLMARAPIYIDFHGSYSISNIPFGVASNESAYATGLHLPGNISLGYSHEFSQCLRMGVDVEWLTNSTHDDLVNDIGVNQALLGSSYRQALNWDNSWNMGFSLEKDASKCLTLRGGYMFSKNPMPDSTFTPLVPANDRHLITTGFGLKMKGGTFDLGYALGIYEDRQVTNNQLPQYNGDWEFLWHQMTASYTVDF